MPLPQPASRTCLSSFWGSPLARQQASSSPGGDLGDSGIVRIKLAIAAAMPTEPTQMLAT